MRGRLPLALALFGSTVVLIAGSSGTAAERVQVVTRPLYGLLVPMQQRRADQLRAGRLVRLDPRTLVPLEGRGLAVASLRLLGRSPDGRFAAFAGNRGGRLRILDLTAMRVRGSIALRAGSRWDVREGAWLTADRLLVVVQRNRGAYRNIVAARQILVIDPLAGRVIARRPLAETRALRDAASAGDKLVLMLGRADARSGRVRLTVIDSAGRSRTVDVGLGPIRGRFFTGLVLEPSGQRAFLIAAGSRVVEVDLNSLTTTQHTVRGAGQVLAAHRSASRRAVLVGDQLAVTGQNLSHVRGLEVSDPVGLALIDTTTWRARIIDRAAGRLSAAGDTVLAFRYRVQRTRTGQRVVRTGIRAYSLDGKRRWQRFVGEAAHAVTVRDRVLVYRVSRHARAASRPSVLDVATGRQVGHAGREGMNLVVLPDATAAGRPAASDEKASALSVDGDGQAFSGTVRVDVSRVVAVLVDGSERELPIFDGAVTYRAASPEQTARLVQAYVGEQLVSTVSLPVTCGGAFGPCAGTTGGAARPEYAFFGQLFAGTTTLARVDARTLLPIGPRLVLRAGLGPSYGRSPDGRYLAIADRDRPSLRIVDLERMRLLRTVDLGGHAGAVARVVAWLSDDRLAAVTQRLSEPTRRYVRNRTLVFADPLAGRVLSRRALTNKLALRGAEATAGRLVVALRSSSGKGSTITLVVADADGRVRSAAVEVGRRGGALNQTAVVVEPSGRRAFVLGWAFKREPPVIEVDLDTMTATSRAVRIAESGVLERATLSGLQAAAFGDDKIVATGAVAASERVRGEIVPGAGVFVIDTRSWTARRLDPRAIYFDPHGDRLVTYGTSSSVSDARARRGRRGSGITIYHATGSELAHLYGYRQFSNVKLAGDYGHVLLGPPRRKRLVFDLRTGKPLGMLPKLGRLIEVLPPPPRASPARRASTAPSSQNPPASPSAAAPTAPRATATGEQPRAFQRPRRPGDVFPASAFIPGQRITDSRLIASYFGRRRPARLYLLKTSGSRGRQICMALVHRGIGAGCDPEAHFLTPSRAVTAGSGQLLSGVAANHVARVVVIGTQGRRHRLRLTPDKGFIFDCRAYNGCTCVVRWLDAFDANGRRVAHQDWGSPTCRR
ncbi:MAG: hypothetical protein ICV59_07605, partial [Thermoleophilia bacterium]|nr:hypothetical protein [Thermoleophilia bacterium]